MSEDQPFIDCLHTFARHDYGRSAASAMQLLKHRTFHWLTHVLLISLERLGRFEALEKTRPVAVESFEHHPWAVALLQMNAGLVTPDEVRSQVDDAKKECQLLYYEGAALLTRGDRQAALELFKRCAETKVDCPEHMLAASEIEDPEPVMETLHRLVARAAWAAQSNQADECLRSSRLIVEIVRDPIDVPTAEALKCLNYLALVLDESQMGHETSGVRDEINSALSRADYRSAPKWNGPVVAAMGASITVALRAPFTRFTGTLKQIDSGRLTKTQWTALCFGFPLFLGRPPAFAYRENPIWEELRHAGVEGDSHGSPYCRRRFSGDASQEFPRARYYTVCSDAAGSDHRTLVLELNAYTVSALTGYCAARSTSDPATIELVFRGLPGEPNPLAEAATDPSRFDEYFRGLPDDALPLQQALQSPEVTGGIDQRTELLIPVACTVNDAQIEHCLDLRQPEAREWTVQVFRNPPAGLIGEALTTLGYAHGVDLGAIRSWMDLVHIINARSYGGNPLTDMFGALLRNLGCGALIYPSTRSDYVAAWTDGVLGEFFGWNLVDYRDVPPSGKIGLDFGNQIELLAGENRLMDVSEGPSAGTVAFYGNTLFSRLSSEQAYRERAFLDSSGWRMKNHVGEVFIRGHFWYKMRYSLQKRDLLLICDSCEERFYDEAAEILPVCPKCGYAGDV